MPFRYMVDQLSRSDARADGDDTVSIDGSSNGTVPEKLDYSHLLSDQCDDEKTPTLTASEHLASGLDVKKVLAVLSVYRGSPVFCQRGPHRLWERNFPSFSLSLLLFSPTLLSFFSFLFRHPPYPFPLTLPHFTSSLGPTT